MRKIFVLMITLVFANSIAAKEKEGTGPYLNYGLNICPNASFEEEAGELLAKYIVQGTARSGTKSVKVTLTPEQAGQKGNCIAGLAPIPVEPNSLYKLEVWVHIPEEITTPFEDRSRTMEAGKLSMYGAFIRGELLDSPGKPGKQAFMGKNQLDLANKTFGTWLQLRGLVKTDKNTKFIRLDLGLEEDAGTAYFDDLSLRKIDNEDDWLCLFETPDQRNERIGWWKKSGYGMFPIYGIYSIPAGEWKGRYWHNYYAEWLTHTSRADVSRGESKALAEVFRPNNFDANEYVRLAKEAGMSYIVITAKFHDGFAMWPTKCDKFNIKDCSGVDRDILMELKEACEKADIKFGVYYSQAQDWYTPGGFDISHAMFGSEYGSGWDTIGRRMREVDVAPFELTRNYLENKSKPQLVELMKRYNPYVIWFDVPSEMNLVDGLELLAIVRKHNPKCVTGRRLHTSGALGDFATMADYAVPEGTVSQLYWESVFGAQQHTYSWDQFQPYRSPELIFEDLNNVRSKGGNYLLAIGGPRGDGSIPEINFEILRKVKAMIDKQGGFKSLSKRNK